MNILKHNYIVQTVTDVHYDELGLNDVTLTQELSKLEVNISEGDIRDWIDYIEYLEEGIDE